MGPGAVPAWRDLTPGETGPDVAEPQDALSSLGYYGHGRHTGVLRRGGRGVPALAAREGGLAVNGAAGEPFLELAARGSLALTGQTEGRCSRTALENVLLAQLWTAVLGVVGLLAGAYPAWARRGPAPWPCCGTREPRTVRRK
jgi:hypothetical protein